MKKRDVLKLVLCVGGAVAGREFGKHTGIAYGGTEISGKVPGAIIGGLSGAALARKTRKK